VNLAYYQELMSGMRLAIENGQFEDFAAKTRQGWAKGDMEPL